MERRKAASSRSAFTSKLRNFKNEINLFWTYSDWNITAAFILTFVTDLITLLLNLLEPLFVVCLGYRESLSLFNVFIFYEFFMIFIIGFMIIQFANLNRYQTQIIILWIHAGGIFLFPFIITSVTSCFPDIEIPRPIIYLKFYSLNPGDKHYTGPEECSGDINNCHSKFFNRLMTVMMISVIVGVWHSVFYGIRAWNRLSTMSTPATPISRPLMRIDEEEYSQDEYDYRADESSLQSSPQHHCPAEAAIPTTSGRSRGKGAKSSGSKKERKKLKHKRPESSIQSTDSSEK